jgi:hypothetical protein
MRPSPRRRCRGVVLRNGAGRNHAGLIDQRWDGGGDALQRTMSNSMLCTGLMLARYVRGLRVLRLAVAPAGEASPRAAQQFQRSSSA